MTRPLSYREPRRPREKGIDVALAVEVVRGAIGRAFDVAVLFSGDTDLLPVAEFVCEHRGHEAVEFAGWKPSSGQAAPVLRLDGRRSTFHLLDEAAYRRAHDTTDYTKRTRRR